MNVGLVLSGGMAKGAYQIGALRAIAELVPQEDIRCISCASVGVLNGYAYATGNLDGAENMWRGICAGDSRLIISQVLKSSTLQQDILRLYDPSRPLSAVFYTTLLDLNCRNVVYKDLATVPQASIPQYLRASVAMPVYNRAVQIGNISYYDGAVIDNIPVFPLASHKLDYIICIYFDDTCYKFENTYFDDRIVKITFPCDSRLKQSLIFQREGIEEMLHMGYTRTSRILRYVFSEGSDNLTAIYRAIRCLNRVKNNSLRITGDVLVTNLNKFTQRLTTRTIL